VVVLTSSSTQEDVNQCYELGANAYLVKPLELEQALSLLRSTVMFWSACKFHLLKG
jgi:CheY-like chemotaxis protein